MLKRLFAIILTFVIIFSFSIITFAKVSIGSTYDIYLDNSYFTSFRYNNNTTTYSYLYLIFDISTNDEYDYHIGKLEGAYLHNTDFTNSSSINITSTATNYCDLTDTINTLIITDEIIGHLSTNTKVMVKSMTIKGSNVGSKYLIQLDYSKTNSLQNYKLFLYSLDSYRLDTDLFNNSTLVKYNYNNTIYNGIRIIDFVSSVTQDFYNITLALNQEQMNYITGSDTTLYFNGYVANNITYENLYNAWYYNRGGIINIKYSSISTPVIPDQPPDQPTVEHTTTIYHPPVHTTGSNSGGDLENYETTTLVKIIDHVFEGLATVMSGLLNNCVVFGVPLLAIIGVCLLIMIIIFLVKVGLK